MVPLLAMKTKLRQSTVFFSLLSFEKEGRNDKTSRLGLLSFLLSILIFPLLSSLKALVLPQRFLRGFENINQNPYVVG